MKESLRDYTNISFDYLVTPLRVSFRGVPRANIRRRSSSATRILAGIVRGSLSDVQPRGSRPLDSTPSTAVPFVSVHRDSSRSKRA